MLAVVVRSGLVEAFHDGAVAVADSGGRPVARFGDIARPFYFRSAAKPFQATVSQRLGADLVPEELALACASHDGDPVHLALVERMLERGGLSEDSLRCPPGRPLGEAALLRQGASGPRRLWHNCSGKHAAMLRACVAQGWDTAGYDHPEHPLQRAVAEEMAKVAGSETRSTGVDGCGVPTFVTTTESMARAFARLASDEAYDAVRQAMHRFPALVSGTGNADAVVATWLDGAAKRGAEGCVGVALRHRGAIAVKVWDGATRAVPVALLAALDQMGWLPDGARGKLEEGLGVGVSGGGRVVGAVEPRLELERV